MGIAGEERRASVGINGDGRVEEGTEGEGTEGEGQEKDGLQATLHTV